MDLEFLGCSPNPQPPLHSFRHPQGYTPATKGYRPHFRWVIYGMVLLRRRPSPHRSMKKPLCEPPSKEGEREGGRKRGREAGGRGSVSSVLPQA
jgi:hypothetical protein